MFWKQIFKDDDEKKFNFNGSEIFYSVIFLHMHRRYWKKKKIRLFVTWKFTKKVWENKFFFDFILARCESISLLYGYNYIFYMQVPWDGNIQGFYILFRFYFSIRQFNEFVSSSRIFDELHFVFFYQNTYGEQ